MHNYHDTHNTIPPGEVWHAAAATQGCWGWGVLLLPFLEQTPLHDQLNPQGGGLPTLAQQPMLGERLSVFSCPTDIGAKVNPYFGQYGTSNYMSSQGVFRDSYLIADYRPPTPFAKVVDGLSNTIMVGERALDAGGNPWKSVGGVWAGRVGRNAGGGGSNAMLQGRGAWPPNTPYPGPTGRNPDGTTDPLGKRSAWTSYHPGGINVVLSDGAVRFISENIDSLTSYPTSRSTNFYFIQTEAVANPAAANRVYQNLFRPDDGNPIGQF